MNKLSRRVAILAMAFTMIAGGVYATELIKSYKTPRGNIAAVEKIEIHKERIGITVNGESVKSESWYNEKEKTFVRLREVAELLGAEVKYNSKTMSADIVADNTIVLKKRIAELEAEVLALKKEAVPKDQPVDSNYSVSGLVYKGLTNISNEVTDNVSTNVHLYILQLANAEPINIYVTENYIKEYGLGFGYEEIKAMMDSIEKNRQGKPYLNSNNKIEYYFYINSKTSTRDDEAFPSYVQAQASSQGRSGSFKTKIYINGAGFMNMDFRPRVLHEIAHYYDVQTFKHIGYESFGNEAGFWYQEGAAEFASYTYYTYPKNNKNPRQLPILANSKETIIQYALDQRNKDASLSLVDRTNLKSFNDLNRAANNNYGIANSFYWYLSKEYGEKKVREYINYVDRQPYMNPENLANVTKEYFGKSEQAILANWQAEFPEFF